MGGHLRRGRRPRRRGGPRRRRALPAALGDGAAARPPLAGALLAVADKIDNIAGAWVAGEKPSGSRDPYGLRRAAMGIVRIALEYGLRFPLAALLAVGRRPVRTAGHRGPRRRAPRGHRRRDRRLRLGAPAGAAARRGPAVPEVEAAHGRRRAARPAGAGRAGAAHVRARLRRPANVFDDAVIAYNRLRGAGGQGPRPSPACPRRRPGPLHRRRRARARRGLAEAARGPLLDGPAGGDLELRERRRRRRRPAAAPSTATSTTSWSWTTTTGRARQPAGAAAPPSPACSAASATSAACRSRRPDDAGVRPHRTSTAAARRTNARRATERLAAHVARESGQDARGGNQDGDKHVYDFSEGNKTMRELLGGKGANLAEMTAIGLPVPPGFTITTEVCTYYSAHGDYPDGVEAQMEDRRRIDREEHGQEVRRRRRPAARSRALRRARLDAGHDGHDPQPRPQRPDRRRALVAEHRQRALRLGLLPPLRPDVRRRRPRRAEAAGREITSRSRSVIDGDQARAPSRATSRTPSSPPTT